MAKLTVIITEELDKEFRDTVFRKKGLHKGNISEAVFEALHLWIKENQK
jgi:hypothetical protein